MPLHLDFPQKHVLNLAFIDGIVTKKMDRFGGIKTVPNYSSKYL